MLALVASLVVSIAPAVPVAGVTCGDESPTCAAALENARDDAPETDYATPAVVDCRSPVAAFVLATFVGECDGTVYDASYRVSRSPEREEVTRALLPATRERRRAVSSCDSLPPKGGELARPDTQPLAMITKPGLTIAATRAAFPPTSVSLSSRFPDPPDRPPRV